MRITLEPATLADVPALAGLRCAVAEHLTATYGKGHWSSAPSERSELPKLKTPLVCVAKSQGKLIAALRLQTKKPWAIDTSYFTPCKKPLYLVDMAVDPRMQRRGIGRLCIEEAKRITKDWPADAIRLDAYDADAGAGEFYRKCGFREVGRVTYRKTPLIYYEMIL